MPNQIEFGDSVAVRSSPETKALGLDGLRGPVYGKTTPSVTGVEVIGTLNGDYAINVYFESLKKSYWFAPELLEFIDHAPGTTVTLDSVDKKWVRETTGEWHECPTRRPWWQFW